MQYKGYYWALFASLIRKSIAKRYGKNMADLAVRNGKREYRKILENADELGQGNPMASNAYVAYVFVGAWLGTDIQICTCLVSMQSHMSFILLSASHCLLFWRESAFCCERVGRTA